MKLAIISLGGKSSLNILKEANGFFDSAVHIDIRQVDVHATDTGISVQHHGQALEDFDCVYVRGSFKYVLLQRSLSTALESKAYLPLRPEAFTIGHNKFLTLLALLQHKIRIPTTYLAATTQSAKTLAENVQYPIILKIPAGTQGKGVLFADSIPSANSIIDTLETFKQAYIIQEYVETNATDIRAIVAGDKVIAAMRRKASKTELRANIHMGATGEPYELDFETEQLAVRSAKAVQADLCAVDILDSGKKPAVIEVNLSPGLEGITTVLKRNIAKEIAEFLHEKTRQFKETKRGKDYTKMMSDLDIKQGIAQELFTTLNIKSGIIKLPEVVTKISGLTAEDEVSIQLEKGKVEIRKHDIKKDKT